MADAVDEQPILLIATEGEWAGRSLESVLVMHGYGVLRAEDGNTALAWARRTRPDAIIVDEHLPGVSGIEVCRQLRDDPSFDAATPIVITGTAPASRTARSEAHAAGAWEFCTHPVDTDTLLMKLGTFLRARRSIAEARQTAFVDPATGILTPAGFQRWAEQLAARANRNHEPLACVVLMPVSATIPSPSGVTTEVESISREIDAFLSLSRDAFRRSDVVGRTEDGRVALLAPDTDADGVQGLLARLKSAVVAAATQKPEAASATEFKAGYWAVPDFASSPVDPSELLRRAAKALEHANVSGGPGLGVGFDQLPVS